LREFKEEILVVLRDCRRALCLALLVICASPAIGQKEELADLDVPAQAELQFGMNVNRKVALYVDGIVGVGGDKLFDWGVGVGLRIKY